MKSGVGVKYVNTVYQIVKKYFSWVELVDIYKVTSPPYRLTTSIHFCKPFSERDPLLFSKLKPDQSMLGGSLLAKDMPTGEGESVEVPTVYDPRKPNKPKPTDLESSDNESFSEPSDGG